MITLSSAELVVPAVLDGVGIGMGRQPIIDPLLKDGRLAPLFRDRAIGKAACYLVRARNAQEQGDERTQRMIHIPFPACGRDRPVGLRS
jgi:DNA-binding transcriptional LysR family regulator